jgi:hypothetical protein
MTSLHPSPGYVLVELGQQYSIATPEEKYNTTTEGVCVGVDSIGGMESLLQKRLFWEEFNASKRIEKDGKTYCFIKMEDIRGYEANEEPN